MIKVAITRVRPDALLPRRMSAHAAGWDLTACLGEGATLDVAPGERLLVSTGLRLAIPTGYEGQVRPRSGWALRDGITVLNAPGTIDADYRGELQVLLVNLGRVDVRIAHGDRIAQLVIAPVAEVAFEEKTELPLDSARGEGGFGSTGHRSHDDA
jgi:dUTP pyrophosphatase